MHYPVGVYFEAGDLVFIIPDRYKMIDPPVIADQMVFIHQGKFCVIVFIIRQYKAMLF